MDRTLCTYKYLPSVLSKSFYHNGSLRNTHEPLCGCHGKTGTEKQKQGQTPEKQGQTLFYQERKSVSGALRPSFRSDASRPGSSQEQKHVRRPASKIMNPSLEKALRGEADFVEASSDCVGQAKTIEKEHCGEVRRAHERKEREETNRIGDEICPITCISFISL